jgi:transglutaminase-like putative cysteine protease
LAGICRAADPIISVAPPTAWISPVAFQRSANPPELESGEESRLLLADRQINAQTSESFLHEARQLLTAEGAQNNSSIAIDFDTNQQSLVFHWVKVWRGSNFLNRLDPDQVKVIQPERDWDRDLFNGQKSAVLPLEDVRAGDILDYAYTVRGDTPLGAGKFSDFVTVQKQERAQRLRTRLVWPRARHLYIKNHGTEFQPVVLRQGAMTEYTWDCKNVEGVRSEDSLPVWYSPLPWVQLSEFQKWSEVNQWELAVFTNSQPLSPDLARQIAAWRRLPDAEQQVLAVLRFLQDEVRQAVAESGSETYRAANPSAVFARRFGDGKDKTLLCVTILRALGIESCPVLVAADFRQTLQNWQPAAAAFNHALVQVVVGGRTYWLEPSAGFQRGPLAARSWPNYGLGLLVRPGTDDLAVIPVSPVQPRTTVTEYFLIRAAGQPTDLKVVIVMDGSDAETIRRRFSTTGRAVLQAQDLNNFAGLYPGIALAAPLEYLDDKQANEVVVTEYYRLGNMLSHSPSGIGYVGRFYTHNIDRVLRRPRTPFRSMPLGLTWPEHQIFRAEIILPDLAPVDTGYRTIENAAFHFHKSVRASASKVLLEEEYISLTDAVPAALAPAYSQQLDQVFDLLDYTLLTL